MAKMKKWRCPKCNDEIEATASAVAHRCKSNQLRLTAWEEIENGK